MAVSLGFMIRSLPQIHQFQDAACLCFIPPTGQRTEHSEILPAREVIVKMRCLINGPDMAQRSCPVLLNRITADTHLSKIRPDHAQGDAQDSALPCPIMTQQTEDLPLTQIKAHVIQCQAIIAPAFGEISNFEESHSKTMPSVPLTINLKPRPSYRGSRLCNDWETGDRLRALYGKLQPELR